MEENEGGERTSSTRRWLVLVAGVSVLVLLVLVYGFRLLPGDGRDDPVPVADVSSERLLGVGNVVGFAAAHDTHAWLGIPYARPPVGSLRWRAPALPDAWADTFDALTFGPACPQLASSIGGVPAEGSDDFAGAEDCLYLNVWAPRTEPEEVPIGVDRLPVMVWIHGGGNWRGSAGSSMYDGAMLAGSEQVIVVSLNYRLGPLGWFAHPAIRQSANNAIEASGNFGTLDQIRALEWVQSNIEEFGGDPENVTLFGQSAGGTNVFSLLLADSARGLFHRAIAQSGSTDSVSEAEAEHPLDGVPPGQLHSSAETVVSMLTEAGVVPDRDAARRYASELPPEDLAEILRSRTPREVLDAYRDPEQPGQLAVPNPIRDGVLLPTDDWIDVLRSGRWNQVPLLVGSNRDEEKLYLSQDEKHARKTFGVIYRIRDLEDYERRARYHSDLWAVRGVTRPAAAIQESGWNEIYAYRFDWDGLPRVLGQDMSTMLGAAHGLELPFLFGTFDVGDPLMSRMLYPSETGVSRSRLSRQMMGYWAEFARSGRPARGGRDDLPEWLRWSSGGSSLLVFDRPDRGGIRMAETRLSRDEVIAAVAREPALAPAEKCELVDDLFSGRRDLDAEAFRQLGRMGCSEFEGASSAESDRNVAVEHR